MDAAIITAIVLMFYLLAFAVSFAVGSDNTDWHYRKLCDECGHHEENHFGNTFFGFTVCPDCGAYGRGSAISIEKMRWHQSPCVLWLPQTWGKGHWEVKGGGCDGDEPEDFDQWRAELKQCMEDNA